MKILVRTILILLIVWNVYGSYDLYYLSLREFGASDPQMINEFLANCMFYLLTDIAGILLIYLIKNWKWSK